MTLKELKDKYDRLGNQIDGLAGQGVGHEARLISLQAELDQVHRELSELRRRTWAVPTLRDVVSGPVAMVLRPVEPTLVLAG
ncbi:MAG: hypothetical protein KF720_22015 [Rubrivivax sp.]|nr:hypothetical protein [Rubrivivax sp.]